jgi:hypothetical protein
MIALVLSMLRARLGRALTALALAVVAVAAAVAGPAFMAAADRSVIADELSQATPAEQALETQQTIELGDSRDRTFESGAPALLSGPGLTPVFAAEFDAYLQGPVKGGTPRLVFRDGVCAHVRMVQGRCPVGTNEIMLGEATSALIGVHSGQTVMEQESITTKDGPTAIGDPATLSVVGIFRVIDTGAPYWADQHYFDSDPGGFGSSGITEPAFASRGTLEALTHGKERQSVDSLLDPGALTPQGLASVRAGVMAARSRGQASGFTVNTGIPALFARVDADRSTLREVVPLAAVPLVVLTWLVMLLAAGYATETRRAEVGLLKLRGTTLLGRWWLMLGESVLAILVGSVLGYLAGYAVVAATARLLLSNPGPVAPSWQPLRWAGAAVLGTLIVTVLATRRPFAVPVADLLRQVPPRGRSWRGLVLEAMLYPLTVAAVAQMLASHGRLTGIMLLAPGLVVLAFALLVARLVGPVAGWVGGRALRGGRLGLALGALRLARRPGAARLLALLVVAVAQLTLAVTGVDIASQARVERATIEQGASRVLNVLPVERGLLLDAVRAADPTGRYAMAVETVPAGVGGDYPVLAVDSSRLAAVALWPRSDGMSAAQAAAALRPPTHQALTVAGDEIGLDLTADDVDPTQGLQLLVHLAPLDGSSALVNEFGPLRSGRHTYVAPTPGCRHGCRIMGLEVSQPNGAGFDLHLVVHGLTQGDPATPVDAGFAEAGRWRGPASTGGANVPKLATAPDGLTVALTDNGLGVDPWILPADAPYPLPAVATAPLGRDTLGGLDGNEQPVVSAGTVEVLPHLGTRGLLVDMEYAERDARETGEAVQPQVWLAADAPANLVDRLHQVGLTITGSQTTAARVRYLNRQGPAAGLRFHLLAGALAVVLALSGLAMIATVDRRAGGQLRALRIQGVPRTALRAANGYGYLGLVLAALVLGPIAAAGTWALTGRSIPLFADGVEILLPPLAPHWSPVLGAWAATGLLLLAAAWASSRLISAGSDGRRGERE